MNWQQKLGQVSPSMKQIVNQWDLLAWINLGLIWLINFMLILYLEPNLDPTSSESVHLKYES